MTFWTLLRWAGALTIVLIVLGSLLIVDRSSNNSFDPTARHAPTIVR